MILPLFFNFALLPVGKGSGVRGQGSGVEEMGVIVLNLWGAKDI